MKQELEQKLFERHGKLFRDRTRPIDETCMCWGVECGDGWYALIDLLCERLGDIATKYDIDIVFSQVKEKYGTLRAYYDFTLGPRWTPREDGWPVRLLRKLFRRRASHVWLLDGQDTIDRFRLDSLYCGINVSAYAAVVDAIDLEIAVAELFSSFVCEYCGTTGARRRGRHGYLTTICPVCAAKEPGGPYDEQPVERNV